MVSREVWRGTINEFGNINEAKIEREHDYEHEQDKEEKVKGEGRERLVPVEPAEGADGAIGSGAAPGVHVLGVHDPLE